MSNGRRADRREGRSAGRGSRARRGGGSFTRVGSVIEEYLAAHPRMQYEVKANEAVTRWPLLVDEYVRLHTEAVMVKDRVLFVHADSSALASELTLREEEHRNRLNRALKVELLQRIVFKSGRVSPAGRGGEPAHETPPRLSTEHLKQIEAAVRNLREEELREVMRRLLREMAERERKNR